MKTCPTCRQSLSADRFAKSTHAKDGLQHRCRACVSARNKTPKAREQQAEQRNKTGHKDAQWRMRLRRLYGIDPAVWESMFSTQGGRCPGCAIALGRGQSTYVDHCHITGKVRGLLCRKCNLAIGHAADRPAVLRNLLNYLTGV